jgi:hypothetical protein
MTWPIFWFVQADASLPGSVAELLPYPAERGLPGSCRLVSDGQSIATKRFGLLGLLCHSRRHSTGQDQTDSLMPGRTRPLI